MKYKTAKERMRAAYTSGEVREIIRNEVGDWFLEVAPDSYYNWSQELEDAYNNDAINVASIVLRKRQKSYKKLVDAINKNSPIVGDYIKRMGPLVQEGDHVEFFCVSPIREGDNGKLFVRYFKNLPMIHTKSLEGTTFAAIHTHLMPLWSTYNDDMAHPKRCNKWKNPSKTVRTTVRKPLVSFLRDLLVGQIKCLNDDIPDHVLRDLGEAITASFKPPCVIFADTPEKMIEMYEGEGSPSSCMRSSSDYARHWRAYASKDFHPTMFFLYCPEFDGYYMKRGNRVMARLIIMWDCSSGERKDPKPLMLYTNGTLSREEADSFYEAVSEKVGQKVSRSGDNRYQRERMTCQPFTVPGHWVPKLKDYVLPLPWFDGYHKTEAGYGMYAKFNIKTREFTIFPGRTHPRHGEMKVDQHLETSFPLKLHSNTGLIGAKSVLGGFVCHSCGRQIPPDSGSTVTAEDGAVFCNRDHAYASNYYFAKDAQGDSRLLPREGLVQDALHGPSFYTNLHAAECNRALPILDIEGCAREDRVSAHGVIVLYQGKVYTMDANVYNCATLRNGRMRHIDTKVVDIMGASLEAYVIEKVEHPPLTEGLLNQIDW